MGHSRVTSGLWRDQDFLKLWSSTTISSVGSQVTRVAMPLTAVVTLGATPTQVGALSAAERAPFLFLALFAGVWVDRLCRRPVLIWTDLGRGLLLGCVPFAAALGLLRMEQLYAIVFLAGVLTVFHDVASQSYLPALVGREQVAEGNAKLWGSSSFAGIAGAGVGGGLVTLLTAPGAILVDSISFAASALLLLGIRKPERLPERIPGRSVLREVGEGLGTVFGHPLLRPLAGCGAIYNFAQNLLLVTLILYATRQLRIGAGALGLVFAVGGVGFLVGVTVSGRLTRRLGLGRTIYGGLIISGLGALCLPLARGHSTQATVLLGAAQFVYQFGYAVYNIEQVNLRQIVTPDRLMGRVNATMRTVMWSTMPLGSLAGGVLSEAIGLRPTLIVGGACTLLASVWVYTSQVRRLREQPVRDTAGQEPVVVQGR